MAGFNAGQFSTGERGFSDVESVQAPVVENKVAEGAALLDGINSAVNTGVSIATTYKANAKAEAVAAEKEAKKTFGNQYDTSIRKYAGLVSNGQMTQMQANTYLQRDKDSLLGQGANADDLTSTELQTTKTLAGRALIEGSQEEQAQKRLDEEYNNSTYWTPDQGPIQRQIGMANLRKDALDTQARATKMSVLALEAAQFDKNSNEYKLKQQEIKTEQMGAINNALLQSPVNAANEQERLVAEYKANKLKIGEAEAEVILTKKWNDWVGGATRMASAFAAKVEGGLPVQQEAFTSSIKSLSEPFLASIGEGQVVAAEKKLVDLENVKLQNALINSSKPVQMNVALRGLFGDSMGVYAQGITTQAGTDINNFHVDALTRKEGDPVAGGAEITESLTTSRDILTKNIKSFLDGTHQGEPKDVEKLLSYHVAKVSEAFKTLSTKEIDKSIAFLATPEVGRFIKMRGLSNADLDNVNRQVFTYKGKVADNFVSLSKTTLSNDARREEMPKTSPRMIRASQSLTTGKDFDLVFEGGQVMVRSKTERGRAQAEELNNKITGPLTRVVRVDSNLSGKSQESIFNSWKEQLWPDETQQEQAPATQEVATVVDYSQYEGKTGVDEEGNTFVIRNGIPVKVGGADGK
jgi:hypothetical protein